nr:hypothetical protein [Mycobacteroides abscessus]
MAYLKPPWFVRKVFNRVATAADIGRPPRSPSGSAGIHYTL